MKEQRFFNILRNIFTTRIYLLITVLVFTLMIFISFLVKNTIIPSFKEQIVANIIDDTTRLTYRISKNIDFENLNKEKLDRNLEHDLNIFKIYKVHYFDEHGKIIYSSNQNEAKLEETASYFFDVIAKGQIYYEIDEKADISVLEIYIPILKGTKFLGAFEVYYNISSQISSFEELSSKIMSSVVLSGTLFLILFFIIMYNASKNNLILKNNEYKLKNLANTDSLTKLYNRRYFYKIAMKILKLSRRSSHNICVCMIDIDNFKLINDTYGHHLGDFVIKNLAKNLTDLTRESDIVARYGGEEFILLLPNTNLSGAKVLANKICKTISEQELIYKNTDLSYTISMGISSYNGSDSIDDFIIKADESLYMAKHAGKNQVVA
ncbi:GGDEF domain-containing protein [Arcobacter sp. YIC-464]|uniref:GGDEF domain-containing protein n=1 Tax=Arcobacter sp. YIC-464 TaxID=3376631 RepID=UPI003C263B0B